MSGAAADEGSGAGWRPHAMLTLAFVFFALNVVVGRAAHLEVPPVALALVATGLVISSRRRGRQRGRQRT